LGYAASSWTVSVIGSSFDPDTRVVSSVARIRYCGRASGIGVDEGGGVGVMVPKSVVGVGDGIGKLEVAWTGSEAEATRGPAVGFPIAQEQRQEKRKP
jgi:hypothetical protein